MQCSQNDENIQKSRGTFLKIYTSKSEEMNNTASNIQALNRTFLLEHASYMETARIHLHLISPELSIGRCFGSFGEFYYSHSSYALECNG